ncbi:MAG: hypothetical protein LRY55_13665 [Leadbetterella sp.]|nr:hypothetical protein [Leadbetterella sp.]
MKRKLFAPVLALLFLLSCSHENVPFEEETGLSKDRFLSMSLREQFAAMVQRGGGISKIDIQDLELQRISTGVIRNFPGFAFNYSPAIDIFELTEQGQDTYSIGLRKGGPGGQVLDVAVTLKEGSDPWVEVNGIRYNVQLNSYRVGDCQDAIEYTFTPTGAIPGTSEDYLNLIAALNNSNNGDAIRPDLPISDLQVLSLGSLKLTVLLNTQSVAGLPVLGTCVGVTPLGGLSVKEDGHFEFNSGAGTIIQIIRAQTYLQVSITYKDSSTYELWGGDNAHAAQHENFNGKHIKDRIGNNRTIILPDGTKITLVSAGPTASVTALTIYSGGSMHHLNISCNKLEYSATDNPDVAQRMDELQADGETSLMEETPDEIWLYNIYNEDTPCNRVYQRVNLASRPTKDNPKQVNDWYDDPRIGNT